MNRYIKYWQRDRSREHYLYLIENSINSFRRRWSNWDYYTCCNTHKTLILSIPSYRWQYWSCARYSSRLFFVDLFLLFFVGMFSRCRACLDLQGSPLKLHRSPPRLDSWYLEDWFARSRFRVLLWKADTLLPSVTSRDFSKLKVTTIIHFDCLRQRPSK